jgi:translation initiation factor 3 subunit D
MSTFSVPFVSASADPNNISWGPPDTDPANPNDAPAAGNVAKFSALPYAPFGRSDRLGRAADFTSNNRGGGGGYTGGGPAFGGASGRRGRDSRQRDQEEENPTDTFQLVDTTKAQTTKRFVNPASKRRQHSQRLRQINARRQQSSGGAGTASTLDKMTRGSGVGGRGGPGGRGPGGRGAGRGGGRGGRFVAFNNRIDRQSSVAVQSEWKIVEDVDLGKLTKNLVASHDVPEPTDILWCGFLDPYNEAYDKVTARQPVPLKRMEHKEFYPVTTTDDPVLEKLAIDGVGQVFITDAILAHLMTCNRSVYPWDIVIQKLPNGTLFFDKRDNSQFDYLTVQETSYTPPSDEEGINSPERLGLEATVVNQNFSQQILKKSGRKEMDLPNPFFDEDDADGMEPASTAFRYRKFALDWNATVVVRTELHGIVKNTQHMTAFALNEYTPSAVVASPQVISWRDKIDSQRGAVLATELKNNSFKLAKWTAQSILAGADQMKIGFVSRATPKNNYEHQILATQFYRPKDFATQITLSEGQMWATFRMFVQMLQKQEEGKYVLMRDPNKAIVNLYKVPPETFEDDE